MSEPPGAPELVITELNDLLSDHDLEALPTMDMDRLRSFRARLNEVEFGLSYCRRMAQGHLDILMAESQRRAHTGDADDALEGVLARLPDLLAQHSRGQGSTHRVYDGEIPTFAEELVADLDRQIGRAATELSQIDSVTISAISDQICEFERSVSRKRQEVHRLIDDVQAQIIERYRTGAASVDELLG